MSRDWRITLRDGRVVAIHRMEPISRRTAVLIAKRTTGAIDGPHSKT